MQCSPASAEIALFSHESMGERLALARAPTKMARTPILHQSRSRRHWGPEIFAFLLSALVRDGGVVDGHHSCNIPEWCVIDNLWRGKDCTIRLRISISSLVSSASSGPRDAAFLSTTFSSVMFQTSPPCPHIGMEKLSTEAGLGTRQMRLNAGAPVN